MRSYSTKAIAMLFWELQTQNTFANDADTYKIPIEFINEKEILTYSKKYKVSYRLKNSFEENIEIISNQIGYNLIISEKDIPYKNVEYKKIK